MREREPDLGDEIVVILNGNTISSGVFKLTCFTKGKAYFHCDCDGTVIKNDHIKYWCLKSDLMPEGVEL